VVPKEDIDLTASSDEEGERTREEERERPREWRIPSHFLLLGAMAMRVLPLTLPSTSPLWDRAEVVGTVWSNELDEISGIAIDPDQPDFIWAHNDSGDRPRVFLLDTEGGLQAEVRLEKTYPYDAEDLTIGPCEPGAIKRCLFLADIGDNRHVRNFVVISRIPLPRSLTPRPKSLVVDHNMVLAYPDGPHDAESLAIHPKTGQLYLVHKTKNGESDVFQVPRKAYEKHKEPISLEKIGAVTFEHSSVSGRLATAADYSPDGRCFTIRTYVQIHTWCSDSEETPLETLLKGARDTVRPPATFQSEALTYSPDGETLYTTSERWPAPLIRLHRAKKR
jgi:hypothetical protein